MWFTEPDRLRVFQDGLTVDAACELRAWALAAASICDRVDGDLVGGARWAC
jgi:hypothetical protein